ncbi:MAG: protein kinase [Planctomycetes bacterium]|nr:protein kinase [Planctomycetota bacterium]
MEPTGAPAWASLDRVDGRYRVVRPLGHGAMGTVFLVEDLAMAGRQVALKALPAGPRGSVQLEYLRQEFRALSALRHPHVVPVHDFGVDGPSGVAYFTMDHVPGVDFLEATQGRPLTEICGLSVQLCRGLEFLHARGYVHHDLKPANVLVSRERGEERARLLDFGLVGGIRSTLPPSARGTVHYMAPEVLRHDRVDARTDLYSLGVMLYEAVAGRLPFRGDSSREVARAHLRSAPEAPRRLRPDCPPALEDLILRLLAKYPADRPRSANEVILELNRRMGLDHALETHETRGCWALTARLVGRDATLADLAAALGGAPGGPPATLLEGAAGLGKSRLLRELRHRLELAGVAWCEASGREGGASPYGALGRVVRGLAARAGAEALAPLAPELGKVAPGLVEGAGSRPPVPLDPPEERERLHDALARLALAAGALGPLVIGLDDLDRADEPTVDWLLDLARRLQRRARDGGPAARLALVLAYRPEDLPPAHRRALGRAGSEGAARRVVLAPLAADEVEALARSMLPVADEEGVLAARVAREAGGNPLLAVEVLQWVAEQGALVHREGRWRVDRARLEALRVPAGLGGVLEGRLEALGPRARVLVGVLAAAGEPVDLPLAAAAAGMSHPDFVRALAELERAALVGVGPGGLGLVHPLVERMGREALPAAERARLHGAYLVEMLSRRGRPEVTPEDADAPALAVHALELGRTGGPGLAQTSRYVLAAAERCRRFHLHARALDLVRRALALASADDREARWALHGLAARLHRHRGEWGEAVAAARAQVECGRGLDLRRRVEALLALGACEAEATRPGAAREAFRLAREELAGALDATHAALAARVDAEEGCLEAARGDHAAALPRLEGAVAALRAAGDAPGLAVALNGMAVALQAARSRERAAACLEEARGLFQARGDEARSASAEGNLAGILYLQGRHAEAAAALGRALEGARRAGYRRGVAIHLENLGLVRARRGDHDGAAEALRESLEIRGDLGDGGGQGRCLAQLGSIACARGDLPAALEAFREALDRLRAPPGGPREAIALGGLADALGERGDYGEALARCAEAADLCRRHGHRAWEAEAWYRTARWRLTLGSLAGCQEALGRSAEASRGLSQRALEVAASALAGGLELLLGRRVEALERIEEAARGLENLDDLHLRLHVLSRLAEALLECGQAHRAGPVLDRLEELARGHALRAAAAYLDGLRARWHRVRGERDEAVLRAGAALAAGDALGMPEPSWRGRLELARAHRDADRPAAAREAYEGALLVVRRVADALPGELRPDYLAHPDRRRLLEEYPARTLTSPGT